MRFIPLWLLSLFFVFSSCVADEEVTVDLSSFSFDPEPYDYGVDPAFGTVDSLGGINLFHAALVDEAAEADGDSRFTPSANCEPIVTVGNCVNLVSGNFFQVDCDMTSRSVEPLEVIRTYDSGSRFESVTGFEFAMQFPLWAS